MNNKYRPSNGSEGDWFTEKFCERCSRDTFIRGGKVQCGILDKTYLYDIDDKEYPKQWTHDKEGNPVCTSFKDMATPRKKYSGKHKDQLELIKC